MINYNVVKITSKLGKEFVIKNHYSHGIHNGPMCYGLFDNDILIGVCAFATPCSEAVRASVFGSQYKNSVTELHRLVLIDKTLKNSESYFIARSLKLLKKDKPNIKAVVSFADATEGHIGIIYQATNALFTGSSSKATFYLDESGRLRHPRQNGVNIKREQALSLGWTPCKREGKYRYIYLLGDKELNNKELRKMLKYDVLQYPKKHLNKNNQENSAS